jgi:hypothetical protein
LIERDFTGEREQTDKDPSQLKLGKTMKTSKIIFALFIAQILSLFAAQPIFCQTETLDIVQYTPPKGWTKTFKESAVVFSDINKTTNAFCVLTVYASTSSAGSPQKDFANQWNELVVKPFKADGSPKTETQTTPEGWQATVAGAQIELEGGIKAVVRVDLKIRLASNGL